MIELDSKNFDYEVLNAGKVLVDFNATWCGPCRMLKPIIEEFSKNTNYKVCACDVDNNEDLAIKFNVYSIPCLILFKNGKEVKRHVGFINMDELKEFVGE